MDLHIDVPWILQVAEATGTDDPAPGDNGVPVAAVARHRTQLFEQAIYDGCYSRAANLIHTLGRCRWLEGSNMAVAAASGVMYLEAVGIPSSPAIMAPSRSRTFASSPHAPPKESPHS